MTPNPYTLDDADRDAHRIATAVRYFPRRDPHAVANVIAYLAESCQTPDQAERAVQACENLARYTSLADLKATIHAAIFPAADPAADPPRLTAAPPLHVCPACPWTKGHSFTPAERLAAIAQTRARCPTCPYLATAEVLAAAEAEDAAELARYDALPPAKRVELETAGREIFQHLQDQFPDTAAYESVNARRMTQRFALMLHRRNTDAAATARGR